MADERRHNHFRTLFRFEHASGLAIILALTMGLAAANSPLAHWYTLVHHAPIHVGIGSFEFRDPLIDWINDGLMAFFFLLVGLELKRELREGHLSTSGTAALPLFAALGGMAVPAAIYAAMNWGDPVALRGWAIPTATDIVLALGVVSVLGTRVPTALKVFLTALAIFDDIGAVLLIGLFYAEAVSLSALALAAVALAALAVVGAQRITHPAPYVLLGLTLWAAMLESGVEPALAGVLIGAAVPMRARREGAPSPLRETERRLQPWVALGVVPLFAFFNSGVAIDVAAMDDLLQPTSLGIVAGLFFGKQVGIAGAAWLAERFCIARRPPGVGWVQLYGAAIVGGIGFTMSLFVATLAFKSQELVAAAKLAVLIGSVLAAVSGLLVLWFSTRGNRPHSAGPE